jgi:hypothetical protein
VGAFEEALEGLVVGFGGGAREVLEDLEAVFFGILASLDEADGASAGFVEVEAAVIGEIEDFGGAAVDELGAELDGERGGGVVDGEDAAADAVTGFEAADAKAGGEKVVRGGEAGSAGAGDEDVVGVHGSMVAQRNSERRGGVEWLCDVPYLRSS